MAARKTAESKDRRVLNIMVIGTDRRARNAFIQALSEEKESREHQFLNFGKVHKGRYEINLYGVPGARHFASLWKAFAPRVDGMILLGCGSNSQDVDNLRFALSTLRHEVRGPAVFINTDPATSDASIESREEQDVRTITCFPSDRMRAPKVVEDLLVKLKD